MASFNLAFTSEFKPLSFAERIAPLQLYKEEWDKQEAAYDNLLEQTETWRDIVNQENSPEAYAMYKRYADDLSVASNALYNNGLNLNTRRSLNNLKRRYYQDIDPIAKASEAMKEANKLRDDKGPDAIFEEERYNSIDRFLHGKTANNRYQSKTALSNKAATITQSVMQEMYRDPEWKKIIDDQYYNLIQHNGGSYVDLMDAFKVGIMQNPIMGNRFSEIRQRLLRESGIENYGEYGQRQIVEAIDTGMYVGLDKPTSQPIKNDAWLNPLERAQLELYRARANSTSSEYGKKNKNGDGEEGDSAYHPGDITLVYENGEWKKYKYGTRLQKKGQPSKDNASTHGTLIKQHDEFSLENQEAISSYLQGADINAYSFGYTWKDGRRYIDIKKKPSASKEGKSNDDADEKAIEDAMNNP